MLRRAGQRGSRHRRSFGGSAVAAGAGRARGSAARSLRAGQGGGASSPPFALRTRLPAPAGRVKGGVRAALSESRPGRRGESRQPSRARAVPGMRAAGGAMACEWELFPSLSCRHPGPARPGKAPRGAVPGAPRRPGVPGPGETGKSLAAGRWHSLWSSAGKRELPWRRAGHRPGYSARPAGLGFSRNANKPGVPCFLCFKTKKQACFLM